LAYFLIPFIGGTIASLLDKYGPFNENLIRLYVRQILEGLEYLHVRNTIHRDIKGANILVDNNGVCKLADFGTATKISGLLDIDSDKIASIKGTVRWMAPEVIKQNSLGR
jgi:mitogen-activated protein kinase kinase kinase